MQRPVMRKLGILAALAATAAIFAVQMRGVAPASEPASSRENRRRDPAALGTIKCDGGSDEITFESDMIDYSPQTPELLGDIWNDTKKTITDLTIKLKPVGKDCNHPQGVDVKIGSANPVGFSSNSMCHVTGLSIPAGSNSTPIAINLNAIGGMCDQFKVVVMASVAPTSNTSLDLDALGTYLFSPTQESLSRKMSDPTNPGVAAVVENNEDESNADLVELSGKIILATADASTISLASIQLRTIQGSSYSDIPGCEITQSGTSFAISGFTLEPGDYCCLAVQLSGVPTQAVRLELSATFQDG